MHKFVLLVLFCLIQIASLCNGQREACYDFCQVNNPEDRFTVGKKRMILIHKEETWYKAKDICERMGMRLLTPTTSEDNKLLGAYLNKRVQGELPSLAFSYWNLWLAINDGKVEGNFKWATIGENLTYTSWANGEPNFGNNGEESCVEISWASKDGIFWNDSSCRGLRRYICEIVDHGLEK